jgi:hypothetical protein
VVFSPPGETFLGRPGLPKSPLPGRIVTSGCFGLMAWHVVFGTTFAVTISAMSAACG